LRSLTLSVVDGAVELVEAVVAYGVGVAAGGHPQTPAVIDLNRIA